MRNALSQLDLIDGFLSIIETGDASKATQAMSDAIDGCSGLQLAFVDAFGNFHQNRCLGVDPLVEARLSTEFNTPEKNPVIASMPRIPDGRFVDVRNFVDMRTLLDSEFYQELLQPRGSGRVAMMSLQGSVGLLSLGIEQEESASLAQAQIAKRFGQEVHRALKLWFASQSPSQSAFALDAAGSVLRINAQEIDHVSMGVLTTAGPGRTVRTSDKANQSAFDDLFRLALAGLSVEMVASGDCGPCRLRLVGKANFGSLELIWGEVTALSAPTWSASTLMSAYGLTPRQASVVLELIAGKPTFEIAQSLGLTPRSVRTYLSAIFAKTETSSQLQLVSKLLGG